MTTVRRLSFILALPLGLATAGLVGCYTVDFDESLADVYYCQSDDQCGENQACWEFRCVDDSGPQVEITGPERLQNLPFGTASLTANFNVRDFTYSDSNEKVEGQGKVEISVMGTDISMVLFVEEGAVLDISSLEPGAHRVRVRALHGDDSPYKNPSATAHAVFFIEDENPDRPQVAIVEPPPGYVHMLGEPLEVTVATRKFQYVQSGDDCFIDAGCDPWGPDAQLCLPATCDPVPNGHSHIYMLPDYPGCLLDAASCNTDYALSLREFVDPEGSGSEVTATIPADRFEEAGTFTFSASLQYNNHFPYPNPEFIVFDQITIEVKPRE
jgi:hypothetical protein